MQSCLKSPSKPLICFICLSQSNKRGDVSNSDKRNQPNPTNHQLHHSVLMASTQCWVFYVGFYVVLGPRYADLKYTYHDIASDCGISQLHYVRDCASLAQGLQYHSKYTCNHTKPHRWCFSKSPMKHETDHKTMMEIWSTDRSFCLKKKFPAKKKGRKCIHPEAILYHDIVHFSVFAHCRVKLRI